MRLAIPLIFLMLVSACRDEGSPAAYSATDKVWQLVELDGKAFDAKATLTFPEAGRIAGTTPCNQYNGAMTAAYPKFETGPIAATKRACIDMAQESAFLAGLGAATTSDLSNDTLTLSNADGLKMVFKSGG